ARRKTREECAGPSSWPIEETFGSDREKVTAISDPLFAVGQRGRNISQSTLRSLGECLAGSGSNRSETSVLQLLCDVRISITERHSFRRQSARFTGSVNFLTACREASLLINFQVRQQARHHVEKLFALGHDFQKGSFQQLLIAVITRRQSPADMREQRR